jgi:hypothetical protein
LQLKLPNLSDAQKSTIVATNGDIIYNTTKNKVETYENGNWINSDRAVTNIANVSEMYHGCISGEVDHTTCQA